MSLRTEERSIGGGYPLAASILQYGLAEVFGRSMGECHQAANDGTSVSGFYPDRRGNEAQRDSTIPRPVVAAAPGLFKKTETDPTIFLLSPLAGFTNDPGAGSLKIDPGCRLLHEVELPGFWVLAYLFRVGEAG